MLFFFDYFSKKYYTLTLTDLVNDKEALMGYMSGKYWEELQAKPTLPILRIGIEKDGKIYTASEIKNPLYKKNGIRGISLEELNGQSPVGVVHEEEGGLKEIGLWWSLCKQDGARLDRLPSAHDSVRFFVKEPVLLIISETKSINDFAKGIRVTIFQIQIEQEKEGIFIKEKRIYQGTPQRLPKNLKHLADVIKRHARILL
ncbi:MAG: hypothetical protein ACOZBH_02230 [Patescibacteria group bacterium]